MATERQRIRIRVNGEALADVTIPADGHVEIIDLSAQNEAQTFNLARLPTTGRGQSDDMKALLREHGRGRWGLWDFYGDFHAVPE